MCSSSVLFSNLNDYCVCVCVSFVCKCVCVLSVGFFIDVTTLILVPLNCDHHEGKGVLP